jgi:hypothetical protein
MIAAALGYITPVQGALLQEAIDVAVILNTLQALGESETVRYGCEARRLDTVRRKLDERPLLAQSGRSWPGCNREARCRSPEHG